MALAKNQESLIDDLHQMSLPLSDEDYKTLYEITRDTHLPLMRISMKLWRAFREKSADIHDLRYPNNGCEEIPVEPPLTEEEKVKFGVKSGDTNNNQNEIAMRELTYNLAPLKEGEQDTNASRMNRWEEAQGMKLSELTDEEWVDVIQHILVLTRSEAEEYLDYLQAQRTIEEM